MQIGVVFPQTEMPPDVGLVRAYARNVANMGYQHLLAYDHVLGADRQGHAGFSGPYDVDTIFHEPLTLFAYLAAAEPRLGLVTGVIVLPQRQAALVAKQAAQIDIFKRGKFRLGVGLGWNAVEYEALGMDFKNRGRRFEEQIALMRRLWQEKAVTFEGEFHKVTAAGLNPPPVQRPIPVWIGGMAQAALKRAAAIGDGVFLWQPLEGGWKATVDQMQAWREAAGQSWDGFGMEARLSIFSANQKTPPDEWKRRVDEWRGLGATHLSIDTMGGGLANVDAHLQVLEEVCRSLATSG